MNIKKIVLIVMMVLAIKTGYGEFDVVEDTVNVIAYDYNDAI